MFCTSGHFPVAMIDWLIAQVEQSQEEEEVAGWKFGILYDIGCNLEKGIKKVCSICLCHRI